MNKPTKVRQHKCYKATGHLGKYGNRVQTLFLFMDRGIRTCFCLFPMPGKNSGSQMNKTSRAGKIHWLFCFEVWLVGEPPECFGTETLDHIPKAGDVITLHRPDGREAGKAKVLKVGMNDLRLEAERLP